MNDLPIAILNDHTIVSLESPRLIPHVCDALNADPMQSLDEPERQRFVAVFPRKLHHLEVTDDHLFVDGPGPSRALQKLYRDLDGDSSPF